MSKSTCSLAGCHGNQTKDILSISTFLKSTNSLLIACKTFVSRVKGLENRGCCLNPPGMGVWVQNSLAWEGLIRSLKTTSLSVLATNFSLQCFTKVSPFSIDTLKLQKMREKLFWECIFALLNLKRKVNIEGQHIYCFFHVIYCSRSIKLNWLPMMPFLVYMHGTHLTYGKPFVRKQY